MGDTATGRLKWARGALWLGMLLPIIYSTQNTVTDVGGVGVLEAVRGGGPIVAYVASFVFSAQPVRRLRFGVPEFAITGFVIICAASALWTESSASSVLLKTVPLAFVYLCAARLARLYPSAAGVLHGVVTVAHLVGIVTLLQWVLVPSLAFSAEGSTIGRLHSIIPQVSSNLLPLVLLVGIFGVLLRFGPRWTYRAPWGVLLVALYAVEIVQTRSRLATAVVAVILVFVVIRAAHRSKLGTAAVWFGASATLAAVWWALSIDAVRTSILGFVLRGQTQHGLATLTGRTQLWDFALAAWERNPLGGLGYYVGHRIELPLMFSQLQRYAYSNIDSTWIESLLDVGLVGTAFLALFALAAVIRILRTPWGDGAGWAVAGVTAAVVGLSFVNPGIQAPSITLVAFAPLVFASARPQTLPTSPVTVAHVMGRHAANAYGA